MSVQEQIETLIQKFPIFEYGFLKPSQIEFSEKVRTICRTECSRYNTSWSCPPAVGSVETCRKRCLEWQDAFFFSTVHEVSNVMDLKEGARTRSSHEELTDRIEQSIRALGLQTWRLSGDSCNVCERCAWPDTPCRFPDRMHPCIEGQGILVAKLAELCGMDYYLDAGTQLWFSLIFYKRSSHTKQ
ncbi:MAG: DUF2284 domain-containing protein [Eubacterium sp.]|nr:DUF2284 domain-containing protein [Eubacterium sp.]